MTSAERMKLDNEKKILRTVYEEPGICRKEAARRTGLSSQAVTNQVTELLEKKLLVETHNKAEGRGRVPVSLQLNYSSLYLITVRLELRMMEVWLHDLNMTVIAQEELVLTEKEDVLQCLKEKIEAVLQRAKLEEPIQALVISVAGVVNETTGVVVQAEKLHLSNCNLKESLAYLGIPVLVRNDVNLIAAYEKTEYPKDMNFMVVKLDVGIGSAVSLCGKVLKSTNNVAGELGHVTVVSQEKRACSCGKQNCLTKFISREALEKEYGDSYEQLVEDVRKKIPAASAQVEKICEYLEPVLANAITLLDLDHIILCGCSVEHFLDLLYPILEKQLKGDLSYWLAFKGIKIHSDVSMVQISSKFWLDFFFSTKKLHFITKNMDGDTDEERDEIAG